MAQQTQITNLTNSADVNPAKELNVNATDNLITFTADYAGAQTAAIILTPTSGKRIEVHFIYVSTDTTTVDITLEFATSGTIIFKLYTTNFTASVSDTLHFHGAVDEPITLTCGADTFISITYHEV